MHLRGIIPIEFLLRPLLNKFKSFFFRVQLLISLGVFLAIFILVSSWFYFYYLQTKSELKTQGITLTTSLSQNVEPFIVNFDKDQLNQFLTVMLDNPLVLFTGVINAHLTDPRIEVLKKQSSLDLRYVSEIIQKTHYKQLINSKKSELLFLKDHIMFCISPVFSQFVFPDDESTILYNMPRNVGVIGYSFIAYRLPVNRIFSIPLHWLVSISTLFTLVIGWAFGRLITNRLIARIQRIHKAIKRYSIGDIIDIKSDYNDEISDISQAINDLVVLVNINIDQIRHVNNDLKTQLGKQRSKLEAINTNLKNKNLMLRVIVAHAIQEVQQITDLLAKHKNKFEVVNKVLTHMSLFIQYVIEFIQDNQKQLKLTYVESINIYNEIEAFKPFFEFAASQKGNSFVINIPKDLFLQTNKVYFLQSIIQLVLNSAKYTTKGDIVLTITTHGLNAIINVSDSGVGIEPVLVEKTIKLLDSENFTEIDAFSALALGFLGVHNFCKIIGARFSCDSQPNKGTVVTIKHPLKLSVKTNMLNKVTVFSSNEPKVKYIQTMIQKIPSWQCDISDGAEFVVSEQPRLAIIDIENTQTPFKVISRIISAQAKCDFILFLDDKFIEVSLVLFGNDPYFTEKLQQISDLEAKSILIQGLSNPLEEKVRRVFKDSAFYNTFSYNQTISLRVISDDYYRPHSKEPMILVTKSISTLKALIIEKGQPISRLVKHRLF